MTYTAARAKQLEVKIRRKVLTSCKMSTPDHNTDVTERASTSKEKAEEIVDKRGKTNSVVWKWFGYRRSDKLQVTVCFKMWMCRLTVETQPICSTILSTFTRWNILRVRRCGTIKV